MMLEPLFDPAVLNEFARAWGESLIALSVKGLLVLALAFAATWSLRRHAAAARHLVWNLAVLSLFLLPAVAAMAPGLPVPGLPEVQLPAERAEEPVAFGIPPQSLSFPSRAAIPARVEWVRSDAAALAGPDAPTLVPPRGYLVQSRPNIGAASPPELSLAGSLREYVAQWSIALWALLIWETVSLLVLLWLVVGWVRALRLQKRCVPVQDMNWHLLAREVATAAGLKRAPRLLWSDESLTPLTIGVWRSAVILPRQAEEWSVDQRHDVLLHEFAHVQRGDILTQMLAQVACATFWFHPLPWIAAGRMRLERERACDDRVLMAGSRASTYASHLLEMARSLRLESSLATATVAMARRSQLGERLESLLDHRERGRAFGHTARGAALLLALLLVLPLAAMRPAAAQKEKPESPSAPVPPAVPTVQVPRPETEVHVAHEVRRQHNVHADTRVHSSIESESLEDLGDHTIRWSSGNFFFNTDDRRLRVEGDGMIRFLDDETDVEWMEDGAFFELDDRHDGERRRLALDGHGDAGIDRRYWVDGDEMDFDTDGRMWFSDALGEFFDRSGVLAESRVDRWVEEGGIDRALEQMHDVSDWTLTRYAVALLERTDSANERERVLEEVFERMDSDFQRGQLLRAVQEQFFEDEASTLLWVDLTDEIDSDFERARALGMVLQAPNVSAPAIALSLRSADGIGSDFEKARLLVGVGELDELGEEVMLSALAAADELGSDFEKARALIALIPHLEGNPTLVDRFYQVADEMGSDFEYQRVLRALRAAGIE